MLSLTISYRGTTHNLSVEPTDTLASLQIILEELTSVPPQLQKLLYKGKKPAQSKTHSDQFPPEEFSPTLQDVGLKNGTKVTMLGTKPEELDSMRDVVNEKQRKERILRERALKPAAKLRSTSSQSSSSLGLQYRFHAIRPLQASEIPYPPPAAAQAYLERLAADPAVKHIMSLHRFSVGLLTELSPLEYMNPGLRGLNMNKGESIKLRIRTDACDGFRDYNDTRRTLCHELTHNVWGDHDNNFKELNSQLNREVAEYERRVREGTHSLVQGDFYESSPSDSPIIHEHVLGGATGGIETVAEALPLTADERRDRILEAALRRLHLKDEEIEAGCGTTDRRDG